MLRHAGGPWVMLTHGRDKIESVYGEKHVFSTRSPRYYSPEKSHSHLLGLGRQNHSGASRRERRTGTTTTSGSGSLAKIHDPGTPIPREWASLRSKKKENRLAAPWWIARTALQTRCTPTQSGHNRREVRPCSLTPFLEAREEISSECTASTVKEREPRRGVSGIQ
jgi:hypothetical protein